MWPGHLEWMNAHMGWMGLWWIAGFALFIVLIWALASGSWAPGLKRTDDSPETILKRRYARGEIDREEFERRLGDLRR